MKKNRFKKQLIFVCLIILLIPSCKKDNSNLQKQCHIVKLTYTNGSGSHITNIKYDESGRPSLITSDADASSKTITYSSNTVISINRNSSGTITGGSTVILDGNNKITNIRQNNNASGSDWDNYELIYDTEGNLTMEIYTYSGSTSGDTTFYTVKNGDIISLTDGTSYTETFGYYADMPYQHGDIFGIASLLQYGVEGYLKNAHLLKYSSDNAGSPRAQVSYEMNEKGFISKVSLSNTPYPSSYSYEYECN